MFLWVAEKSLYAKYEIYKNNISNEESESVKIQQKNIQNVWPNADLVCFGRTTTIFDTFTATVVVLCVRNRFSKMSSKNWVRNESLAHRRSQLDKTTVSMSIIQVYCTYSTRISKASPVIAVQYKKS